MNCNKILYIATLIIAIVIHGANLSLNSFFLYVVNNPDIIISSDFLRNSVNIAMLGGKSFILLNIFLSAIALFFAIYIYRTKPFLSTIIYGLASVLIVCTPLFHLKFAFNFDDFVKSYYITTSVFGLSIITFLLSFICSSRKCNSCK